MSGFIGIEAPELPPNPNDEGLNITGDGSFSGNISVSGIITASSFVGDGSQLTGIASSGSSDFVRTSVGIHTLSNVGIGTTNPLQNLHIQGNFLVSAGSSTEQHITQKAYELNSGTLSWEGSAGQLFSITNNLTSGSIFSVNDVSGIPSIDVDADGTIELASFGGNVGVGTTNPTSKLHVAGGDVRVGVNTFQGLILTSPNGTKYRLIVSNAGELSTVLVT
jgi:hypothetical protein